MKNLFLHAITIFTCGSLICSMEQAKKLQTVCYNSIRDSELKSTSRRKSLNEDDLRMIFYGAEIYENNQNKSLADPLKTLRNEPRTSPIYFIHESIQAQLAQIDRDTAIRITCCEPLSYERDEVFSDQINKQAKIALNAEHLMSDLAKLKYLSADMYYEKRKIIIKKIISDEADAHGLFEEALSDSINFKDIDFFEFLLKSGAQSTAKILEKIETESGFKKIFLLYKV